MSDRPTRQTTGWRHVTTLPPADEWADLDLYDRCLAEGLKARDDWRTVRSDCPYPLNSAAHSAWMDGYDGR